MREETIMKKQSIIVFSCILIAVLLLAGCNGGDGNTVREAKKVDKRPIITIGVPAPLTGDAAMMGTGFRDAIELAAEQANAKNTKYRYKVVFEDDQLDNAKTVSAFQKMLTADKINAVITFSSGSSHAVVPIAEENKIPLIAIASDPEIVNGKKYAFLHWVTPEAEAKIFAETVKKYGYKKIAIFSTNQQGVLAMHDELVNLLGDTMFPVDEVFDPDVKDFRTAILKAEKAKVDAYMLNFLPGQLIIAAKQVRELGVDKPLTAIEAFEYEEDPYGVLEGQWFVTGDEPANDFAQALQAEYNHAPTIGAANGYDAFNLLVAAFEKAGKNNPDGVVAELLKLQNFDGALGELAVDADHRVQSNAVVKVMRNKKPVKVE
ncbi:ABC transporter substrate-binding protein [Candidatus Woesearchaeota archaeon]|nr:ABC transporter substrate-binding protein [Candidatus Woesearchaeota archaeon]